MAKRKVSKRGSMAMDTIKFHSCKDTYLIDRDTNAYVYLPHFYVEVITKSFRFIIRDH